MTQENTARERTFITELARIREIVERLENSEVDLETGARLYREAGEALTFCRERLQSVRNEIEQLSGAVEQDEDFLARERQQ